MLLQKYFQNAKKSTVLLILFLVTLKTYSQSDCDCVYPIIFIHGFSGNSSSLDAIYGNEDITKTYGELTGIYHSVLNATTSSHIWGANSIPDDNPATLVNEYVDDDVILHEQFTNLNSLPPGCMYAINFNAFWNGNPENPQIIIDSEEEEFGTSRSNESATFKQAYALSKMISHVLSVTKKSKVVLVAHSMGGLIAREYLQRESTSSGIKTWWVDPFLDEGHKVAKLFTIGTPHRGSALFDEIENIVIPPSFSPKSEAARDMRYFYSTVPGIEENPGVYLYGGNESVALNNLPSFYNVDFNCNGSLTDDIYGLNQVGELAPWDGTEANTEMDLPENLKYTYYVSRIFNSNTDGVVNTSRQWLFRGHEGYFSDYESENSIPSPIFHNNHFLSDRISVDGRYHAGPLLKQTDDVYNIIRGLDEPDFPFFAYEIEFAPTWYAGLVQKRADIVPMNSEYLNTGNNKVDGDWYKVNIPSTVENISLKVDKSEGTVCRIDFYYSSPYMYGNNNSLFSKESVVGQPELLELPLGTLEEGEYFFRIIHDFRYSGIEETIWKRPYKFKLYSDCIPSEIFTTNEATINNQTQRLDGSVNYEYNTDLNCEWTIAPESNGNIIHINFSKLDIDDKDLIRFSHQNYKTEEPVIVDVTENSNLESYQFITDTLNINFITDGNANGGTGFELNYTANGAILTDGFDYPFGDHGPCLNADGLWHDVQDFGVNNHLGEDWNLLSGGNTDCEEPVYAIANGEVIYSDEPDNCWGNAIIIRHTLPDGSKVESMYGHLGIRYVNVGDQIIRGDLLGTLGHGYVCSDEEITCHLHLELRDNTSSRWGKPGSGYLSDRQGWMDPSEFINNNRPDCVNDCSPQLTSAGLPTFLWPLEGTQSDYDLDEFYNFGDSWSFQQCGGVDKRHVALDINTEYGSIVGKKVYAAYNGIIKHTGNDPTWKQSITIEHDYHGVIFTTNYNHITLTSGLNGSVTKGELLGTVADLEPGYSDHLHFGVRKDTYNSATSLRGALPDINSSEGDCECTDNNNRTDPVFPEKFIDPRTISYEDGVVLELSSPFEPSHSPVASQIFSQGLKETEITITNSGIIPFTADFALALHSLDGTYIADLERINNYTIIPNGSLTLSNQSYNFTVGVYKIYTKYSIDGENWVTINESVGYNPYEISVLNEHGSPEGFFLIMDSDFNISPNPIEFNANVTANVIVKNIGEESFTGKFIIVLTKGSAINYKILGKSEVQFLSNNEIKSLTFNSSIETLVEGPGDYDLILIYDENGELNTGLVEGGEFQNPKTVSVIDPNADGTVLNVTYNSIDFGSVDIGNSSTRQITLTNNISSTGNVNGNAVINGTEFVIISGGGNLDLTPGQSQNVIVEFSPTSDGNKLGDFIINHNAGFPQSPYNLELSGEGVLDLCNELPSVAHSIDPAGCGKSNGSIYLTINAEDPYYIEWDNGQIGIPLENVSAGIYTTTVTDANGCQFIGTYEVPNSNPPVIDDINTSPSLCNGNTGYAEIEVSGGIPFQDGHINPGPPYYKYYWGLGCSGNACTESNECCEMYAGTYYVTVEDAVGCQVVATVNIESTGSYPETVIDTLIDVSCYGFADGELKLDIVGGTPPYVFDYFSGITEGAGHGDRIEMKNLRSDVVYVRVFDDANCKTNFTYFIDQPPTTSIELETIDGICGLTGGAIAKMKGGSLPYVYAWSDGSSLASISGLEKGTYAVTATDQDGCTEISQFSINNYTTAKSDFSYYSIGKNLYVNNNSLGADSFIWDFGNGEQSIEDEPNYTYQQEGTYEVCLIAENFCSSDTFCLEIIIEDTFNDPSSFYKIIEKEYASIGSRKISQTPDGGFLISGYELGGPYNNSKNILLIKLNDRFEVVWEKEIIPEFSGFIRDVLINDQGDIYVTGFIYDKYEDPIESAYLGKLSSQGDLLWFKVLQDIRDISGVNLSTDKDGNIYWAGNHYIEFGNENMFLAKMDNNDNLLWIKTIGGSDRDYISGMILSEEGNIILTGQTHSFGSGNTDILLTVINSEGNIQYSKAYGDGDPTHEEFGEEIINIIHPVDIQNKYFCLIGRSIDSYRSDNQLYDSYTLVYVLDPNGSIENAVALYGTNSDLYPTDVIQDHNDQKLLISMNDNSQDDYILSRIDPEIQAISNLRIGGISQDYVTDLYQDSFGSIYTLGYRKSTSFGEMILNKSDSFSNIDCFSDSENITMEDIKSQTDVITDNSSQITSSTVGYELESFEINQQSDKIFISEVCQQCDLGLSIINDRIEICTGDSINFDASFIELDSINWEIDGILVSTKETFKYIFNNVKNYSIELVGFKGDNCSESVSQIISVNAFSGLNVTSSISDASCFGLSDGEISLSLNGGVPPYIYNWLDDNASSTLSNLTKGSYSVTLTDQIGCRVINDYNISEPPTIIPNETIIDEFCNSFSGGIHVNASGGSGSGFQYSWQNGSIESYVSNQAAGDYNVTISDSDNCQQSFSFTIKNKLWSITKEINLSGTENASYIERFNDRLYVNRYKGGLSIIDTSQNLETKYLSFDSYSEFLGGKIQLGRAFGGSTSKIFAILNNNGIGNNGIIVGIDPIDDTIINYYPTADNPIDLEYSEYDNSSYRFHFTSGDDHRGILMKLDGFSSLADLQPDGEEITRDLQINPVAIGNYISLFNRGDKSWKYRRKKYSNSNINQESFGSQDSIWVIYAHYPFFISAEHDDFGQGLLRSYRQNTNVFNQPVSDVDTITRDVSKIILGEDNKLFIFSEKQKVIQIIPYTFSVHGNPNEWYLHFGEIEEQLDLPFNPKDAVCLDGCNKIFLSDANSNKVYLLEKATESLSAVANKIDIPCIEDSIGSISVSGQGGFGDYEYNWNTGNTNDEIVGLIEGEYSVTTTDDSGCTFISQISLESLSGLKLVNISSDTYCSLNLGTAQILANYGNEPYTYVWSSGKIGKSLNKLSEGIYYVSVTDDTDCTKTDTITINVSNDSIDLNLEISKPFCDLSNGDISISPFGGNPPYSIQWSNGEEINMISNLTSDTYNIEVKDSLGCIEDQIIELSCSIPGIELSAPLDFGNSIFLSEESYSFSCSIINDDIRPWSGNLWLSFKNSYLIDLGNISLINGQSININSTILFELEYEGPSVEVELLFQTDLTTEKYRVNEASFENPIYLNICTNTDSDNDGFLDCFDCNDLDVLEFPGQIWYLDADNDGYGEGASVFNCQRPAFYFTENELISISGDCDDSNNSIHPGRNEECNGIDDNCNGLGDEPIIDACGNCLNRDDPGFVPIIEQNNIVNCGGRNLTLTLFDGDRYSLSFDGSEDEVIIDNSTELQISGDLTIELWLRPFDFNQRQNPIAKAYGGEGTITLETTGQLTYSYGTSGLDQGPSQDFTSNSSINLFEWTHIAIVRDLSNGMLNWYINGVFDNSEPSSFPNGGLGTNDLFLGNGFAGSFNGQLDEVKIWNAALNVTTIELWYKKEKLENHPAINNLICHYDFEEGYGDLIFDYSSFNHKGITIGNPAWVKNVPKFELENYLWSSGVSGLSARVKPQQTTSYSIRNTKSPLGCEEELNVFVSKPEGVISVIPSNCDPNTASATISSSGGIGGYSYLWKNGDTERRITELSAGVYSVRVQDAIGCEGYEVAVIDSLNTEIINSDLGICPGDSIILEIDGGYIQNNILYNLYKKSFVGEWVLDYTKPFNIIVPTDSGKIYIVEASGVYTVWGGCDFLNERTRYFDPAYFYNNGTISTRNLFKGTYVNNRPMNDDTLSNHGYAYIINSDGNNIRFQYSDNNFQNDCQCYLDNCGFFNISIWELDERKGIWSTGDTNRYIKVGPTSDTEYSVIRQEYDAFCTDSVIVQIDYGKCPCFMVTNTDDNGYGSLREAIDCSISGDTIKFMTPVYNDTISITSNVLEIAKNLFIVSSSENHIYIKSDNMDRVFSISNSNTILIEGLNVICGDGLEGRCIENNGTLTIKNVTLHDPNTHLGGNSIKNNGVLNVKGNNQVKPEKD